MHFYRNEPMELVEGSGKRVRERKRENRVILLFPMMILTNVVCTLLTGSDVTESLPNHHSSQYDSFTASKIYTKKYLSKYIRRGNGSKTAPI